MRSSRPGRETAVTTAILERLDEAAVAANLERLAAEEDEDGGRSVDFQSYSPAAALEWRGYATVRALSVLRDNAIIDARAQRHEASR
jgi:hypothetical protein